MDQNLSFINQHIFEMSFKLKLPNWNAGKTFNFLNPNWICLIFKWNETVPRAFCKVSYLKPLILLSSFLTFVSIIWITNDALRINLVIGKAPGESFFRLRSFLFHLCPDQHRRVHLQCREPFYLDRWDRQTTRWSFWSRQPCCQEPHGI